jgi:hypothetical protein
MVMGMSGSSSGESAVRGVDVPGSRGGKSIRVPVWSMICFKVRPVRGIMI